VGPSLPQSLTYNHLHAVRALVYLPWTMQCTSRDLQRPEGALLPVGMLPLARARPGRCVSIESGPIKHFLQPSSLSDIKCSAVQCSAVQGSAVQCLAPLQRFLSVRHRIHCLGPTGGTVRSLPQPCWDAVQCSTVQCSAVQCSGMVVLSRGCRMIRLATVREAGITPGGGVWLL
jgi:hypothetical protein